MVQRGAQQRLAGVLLVMILISAGMRPATTLGRAVQPLPAAAHGPSGAPVVKGPGATTFLLVIDRSVVSPGVLTAAFLRSLGRQNRNTNRHGALVAVPALVLGSSATPNVRAVLRRERRYSPLLVYLLGMTQGQRLTIIADAEARGEAVFVNAQPGKLDSLSAVATALKQATYYVPVLQARGSGFLPPTKPPKAVKLKAPAVHTPPSVDISAGLPPVGNQATEGSCVGWSTSYYYKTWQEVKEHHWDVTKPANEFSPSFVYNQINGGKDGGSTIYDAMRLITATGDVPLSLFPYQAGDYRLKPSALLLQAAAPYRATSYGYLILHTSGDRLPFNNPIAPLKRWLASGQAFVIGMPVFRSFERYKGGVYDGPYAADKRPLGGHALMVIGYDNNAENTGVGAFRIINQWTRAWGENGYGWLSYDWVRHYVTDAWAMQDALNDPAPVKIKPYPNPSPGGGGTGPAYTAAGKVALSKHAAKHDFIATITFDFRSQMGGKVLEDHTYQVKVELRANRPVVVTQNYQMDDGAVVTGQVGVVTPSY